MTGSMRLLATVSAAVVLVITAVLLSPRQAPTGVAPPPWDEAVYPSFLAHQVAPPRTVVTGEDARPVDVDAIRAAIVTPRAYRPAPRAGGTVGSGAYYTGGTGFALVGPVRPENEGWLAGDAAPPTDEDFESGENYIHMLNGVDYFFGSGSQGVGTVDATMTNRVPVVGTPAATTSVVGSPMDGSGDLDERAIVDSADNGLSIWSATMTAPAHAADLQRTPRALPRRLTAPLLGARAVGDIRYRDADGREESLIPRAYRIQVAIDGPRARTTVEYVFENPHDRALEGTFRYALPRGATPAAFGMFRGAPEVDAVSSTGRLLPALDAASNRPFDLKSPVPLASNEKDLVGDLAPALAGRAPDWGEPQTAWVVEQTRAREVYETIVRRNVDPALLEFAGGNTFQARVFPIAARALKRVYLVFEETLTQDGEELRYQHPLPTMDTLVDIEARVTICPGTGTLLEVTGDPRGSAAAKRGEGSSKEPQSFDLHFAPGDHDALEVRLGVADPRAQAIVEDDPGGLGGAAFFARVRPDLPVRERRAPTDRALFVIDASLSADGPYHGLSADLLDAVLQNDSTVREYAVLLFDIRPRWLHAAQWRTNDAAARAATRAELDRVYLEGATNFAAVQDELRAQSSWLQEAGREPTAFLVSDGEITWGQDRVPELLRRDRSTRPLRWITYELGTTAANRSLFDALSGLASGLTVRVLSADQLDAASVAHRAAPFVLRAVRVVGARASDVTIAGAPVQLFPGQELRVAGRLDHADGAALELDVDIDGQIATTRVVLPPPGSRLAGRAFAELHTEALLSLDDERVHRMVVALSQRFSLANEAASLLILDVDADWTQFDLTAETVDLDDLSVLRAHEEDQRTDRLLGLALDDVTSAARLVVAALDALVVPPEAAPVTTPLLDRPLAGGATRIGAELSYRASRPGREADFETYQGVGTARALAGDTLGALRAWSTLIEQQPRSAEAARLVGYACLALGQPAPAAEVFERVRLQRPFEPQAWLEEALALEAAGSFGEAARRYEIALTRPFARHGTEARVVATRHYVRLLRALARDVPGAPADAIETRLKELVALPASGVDLQLTLHWSSDAVDIDLWVFEPEGERCSYDHLSTAAGGRLLWDITDGYGPELYYRDRCSGEFEIAAHYFGNNSPRWSVPTGALLVVDRDACRPGDLQRRRFQCFVLGKERAVLSLRREEL